MVGVPRSKGCKICRQRRIKCDERNPCTQCVSARWRCPGPAERWHFRDENPKLLDWHKKNPRTTEETSSGHGIDDEKIPGTLILDLSTIPAGSGPRLDLNSLTPTISPGSVERLRNHFVFLLNHAVPRDELGFFPFQPYLSYLPNRIGRYRALDHAVSCICAASNDFLTLGNDASPVPRLWYTSALHEVQRALRQPELAKTSEVLAAIMVLQWYEKRFNDQGDDNWIQHGRGAARLISWRGPDSFTSDLDGVLLKTQLSASIFDSITSGRTNLIVSGPWAEALKHSGIGAGMLTPPGQSLMSMTSDFTSLLGDFTRWQHMRHIYSSKDREMALPHTSQQALAFLSDTDLPSRVASLHCELRDWLALHRTGEPVQSFSHGLDSAIKSKSDSARSSNDHDGPTSPISFHWAFECACATFLLITGYMLTELHTCSSSYGETITNIPINLDSLPPLICLIKDANTAVEVVRSSTARLKSQYSAGFGVLTRAMGTMWRKATVSPKRSDRLLLNDITAVVGDLWTT